ncbi:MAG: ABC transporter permease [Desulfurococcus sp.]|nr:ABC transporter permease [Desulfurococcus sp.]
MSTALKENIPLLLNTLIALAVGFLIGAVLMALGGYNPFIAYASLFQTSLNLGDPYYTAMTLSYATPLMLTGLTFAVSMRAGIFNIGAEGQVYMGALGAVIVASMSLPGYLYLPLAVILGSALGALWGLIAGVLKAWRNINEVVSTIMLNWIAFWIVEYARVYVYYNPKSPDKTISMPPEGRLPLLFKGTELSFSLIIALIAVILTFIVLWYTRLGYSIRVSGYSLRSARYAGIDPRLQILYVFVIGGVLSGLAGVLEIAGRPPEYAITTGASNIVGLGFSGITVALLGWNHPILIILSSVIIGMLTAGSRGMQITANVPLEMVKAVQGIIVISLAVPIASYIVRRMRVKESLRGEEA